MLTTYRCRCLRQTLATVIVCALIVASNSALLADAAPANITHCVMVLTTTTAQAQYGAFSAHHYSYRYPNLALDVQYVGIYEPGGSSLRGVLRNFAFNGTDCDVVIGPGSSNFATAINPLINSAWCDFGSATTDLSSRFDYPLFNRMIPSTSVAATAGGLFLQSLNWNQINVLCANSPYAVSFATVITANLGPNGIAYVNDCIDNAAPYSVVLARLQQFMASKSCVIVVAASFSDPIFFSIIEALQATNATQTHFVLGCEAFTIATNQQYLTIPGLFTVSYAQNMSRASSFLSAFAQRNLVEYETTGVSTVVHRRRVLAHRGVGGRLFNVGPHLAGPLRRGVRLAPTDAAAHGGLASQSNSDWGAHGDVRGPRRGSGCTSRHHFEYSEWRCGCDRREFQQRFAYRRALNVRARTADVSFDSGHPRRACVTQLPCSLTVLGRNRSYRRRRRGVLRCSRLCCGPASLEAANTRSLERAE